MKTVIFDFDGTLADSLNVIVEIFEQLTGRQGQLTKKEMARLRHLPIPVVAKKLDIPMWKVPMLLYRGRRMMQKRIGEVVLYQGLYEAVKRLHSTDYRLLVASSNSIQNVRAFLKANDMEQYFTHVYGGIGLFSKSAALRKILQRNRVRPDECIYIGDESRDIEACEAVGVKCIAVEWGFADPKFLAKHNPYALIKEPAELVSSIGRALA